jgi:mannan endo-1,4-beta-mannosidase
VSKPTAFGQALEKSYITSQKRNSMNFWQSSTLILTMILIVLPAPAQIKIDYTLTMDGSLTSISPYIFGTNQLLSGGENWTALRIGGNRLTGYNWENNASNAGSDWNHYSDNYLPSVFGIPSNSSNSPGIVTSTFQNQAIGLGAYSVVTLQMAGCVAKDKNGAVQVSETAPSQRWASVQFEKNSSFTLQPDVSDNVVYIDEYVHFLTHTFGLANSATGIRGYELDNEPDLWVETHPRLHPDTTKCTELVQRSIALSSAVKKVDPYAEIFGPVSYGFNGFYSCQSAPDWKSVSAGKGYSWFLDYYLDRMKAASDSAGKRLLDVLDVHWYPEAMGSDNKRITDPSAQSTAAALARVQAPRSLWDSFYRENSWIGQWFSSYLPLIPRLQKSIDKYYPGTKLAFTEWNYGGENDISGAIAVVDVLGIFAKRGIYLSTFWQLNSTAPYISAAYKMFRNYDGQNSRFGDLLIPSQASDSTNSSIYGSYSAGKGEIHLIVVNKNFDQSIEGNFSISSSKTITSGKVWMLTSASPTIYEANDISTLAQKSFSYTLPPKSVYHFVLTASGISSVPLLSADTTQDNLSLHAYPNPFNPSTVIRFALKTASSVRMVVYDLLGRHMETLLQGEYSSGSHEVTWVPKGASGIYLCRMEAVPKDGKSSVVLRTEKLVFIK